MKQFKWQIVGLIVFIALIVGKSSYFILDEGRQSIITEFGKPVGQPITNAGLHFKVPFIQEVHFVDKRILSWDGYPNQIPTKDKKYIHVDTTARYRIIDALKFIQTVRNERGARTRLDTILDSTTRDVISNQNLVEAVRNSNTIMEKISLPVKGQAKLTDDDEIGMATKDTVELIKLGREKLSQQIVEGADDELKAFGIELIDVQLRRISYEKSVELKVYERMISERQRMAEKIRSKGLGEKAKIEGRMLRNLRSIQSNAYRLAKKIQGEAEGRATAIYAKTLSKDPKFYEFIKTMEAYEVAIKPKTHFIISSDSEFLKFLK